MLKVSAGMYGTRMASAALKHLWRPHDISLKLKDHVDRAAVRTVLLHGWGTRSSCAQDIHSLDIHDHHSPHIMANIG